MKGVVTLALHFCLTRRCIYWAVSASESAMQWEEIMEIGAYLSRIMVGKSMSTMHAIYNISKVCLHRKCTILTICMTLPYDDCTLRFILLGTITLSLKGKHYLNILWVQDEVAKRTRTRLKSYSLKWIIIYLFIFALCWSVLLGVSTKWLKLNDWKWNKNLFLFQKYPSRPWSNTSLRFSICIGSWQHSHALSSFSTKSCS